MIYYADIQIEPGKVTFIFPAETVGKDFRAEKSRPSVGADKAAQENNLTIF